jgi:hypothetical protein
MVKRMSVSSALERKIAVSLSFLFQSARGFSSCDFGSILKLTGEADFIFVFLEAIDICSARTLLEFLETST